MWWDTSSYYLKSASASATWPPGLSKTWTSVLHCQVGFSLRRHSSLASKSLLGLSAKTELRKVNAFENKRWKIRFPFKLSESFLEFVFSLGVRTGLFVFPQPCHRTRKQPGRPRRFCHPAGPPRSRSRSALLWASWDMTVCSKGSSA